MNRPVPFILKAMLAMNSLATMTLSVSARQEADATKPEDSRYLAQPSNPALPSLFIIGDSTVRNGNGTGKGGQWGWGDFLAPYFDTDKINVVNNALGGTSSRTFYRDRWPGVKAMIKPGDWVFIQFGHNDASPVNEEEPGPEARARGTLDGVGEETQSITNILTKRFEVVHSYGWYLRQFINETRTHGATPIICSPIPRNEWNDNQVRRDGKNYAGWAEQVARSEEIPFLDLNGFIADRYDELGQAGVDPLFIAGAGPHTSEAGAKLNAECVISALKGLPENLLAPCFSESAGSIAPTGSNKPETDKED